MFVTMALHPILTAAAVIPAIALMIYIYKKDRIEKEPSSLLFALVFEGIISTAFAGLIEAIASFYMDSSMEQTSLAYLLIMNFIVVGGAEEGAKFYFLRKKTWRNANFNCQFDGVVYAVFVSLGFALWENIGYVLLYGFNTALVRAVTAVPGHCCFGVLMGAFYGFAKRYEDCGQYDKARRCLSLAVVVPVFTHGMYDFLATVESAVYVGLFDFFVSCVFLVCFIMVKRLSDEDKYLR